MKAFPSPRIYFNQIIIVSVIFLHLDFCFAYQIPSSKEFIKTLSSNEFKGRSTQSNGKELTLKWLKEQVSDSNSSTVYQQTQQFKTTINQINSIDISIQSKKLTLGLDYVPMGTVPSLNLVNEEIQQTNAIYIPSESINTFSGLKKNSVVLLKDFFPDSLDKKKALSLQQKLSILMTFKPKLILIESNSLLFGNSTEQYSVPIIYVKTNLISSSSFIDISINSELKEYNGTNLIVKSDTLLSPKITLMAHYDHLGSIKSNDSLQVFNGANDNASGVYVALNLFLKLNKLNIPSQVVFTDAEELGLIGSKHLSESSVLDSILFLLNFDMMGSSTNGLGVVGGLDYSDEYQLLNLIMEKNNIQLKPRNNAANSDQYWFLKNGIKGFYIYSNNGKQPYHSIQDTYQTLDYTFIEKIEPLILEFVLVVKKHLTN